MQILNDISQFFATHEAAFGVACAWASKEWHSMWPSIKMSFPYIRDNGGLIGLGKELFVGRKLAINQPLVQITKQEPLPNRLA